MKKIIFCIILITPFLCIGCNGDSQTETLTVASEQAECYGVGKMNCFLVKQQGSNEWELFYSNIEGFLYVPGYEYVIKVKKQTVENPPADASSFNYTLSKIVQVTEKRSEGIDRFLTE